MMLTQKMTAPVPATLGGALVPATDIERFLGQAAPILQPPSPQPADDNGSEPCLVSLHSPNVHPQVPQNGTTELLSFMKWSSSLRFGLMTSLSLRLSTSHDSMSAYMSLVFIFISC